MLPEFPLTLTNVLWAVSSAAAIATVTAVVAWAILRERINYAESKVKTLTETQDWNLPETLHALKDASERLLLNDKERKDYEQLRASVLTLTADIQARSEELQLTTARLTDAEKELATYRTMSEDIWVKQGEGVTLIKPDVTLGLTDVHYDGVSITLLNKPYRPGIGMGIPFENRGKRYSLTLMSVDRSSSPTRARFILAQLAEM